MEWAPLLILIVLPHVSTIPLEDFYPFGESAGDEYFTWQDFKPYITIAHLGDTPYERVIVSINIVPPQCYMLHSVNNASLIIACMIILLGLSLPQNT